MSKKRRPARQWGGTFLGIVLGLIVGLAIAVVVALYITKAPTPFVEKTPPRPEANSPAAQSPDPNKALQSRSPLPASVTPPQAAAPAAPPASAVANPALPAPPASPAQNAQSARPGKPSPEDILNGRVADNDKHARDIPQVKSPTTPVPSAAADDSRTGYYLQIGAYKSARDAEQQRASLALQGLEAKVTQRDANGLTLYRVRLGPYARFDDMNRARQRLADAGVDAAVIRFTKQ